MVRFTVPDRSERNARRRPTSHRANGVADGVVRRRPAVAPDAPDAGMLRPGRFDRRIAERPVFVPEHLASFRDIGNWLSPGLAGGL
jgi:hypothetical protein